jgi:uncharacterized membrane protein
MMPPLDETRPPETVWRYRGYDLRASEFTTAMVHYYRAEIQRSNTWRTRLDATTNWAVITTGAAITFALASPDNHFGVIILNTLLVTLFLWIEARRYRYYELWSYRARQEVCRGCQSFLWDWRCSHSPFTTCGPMSSRPRTVRRRALGSHRRPDDLDLVRVGTDLQ